MLCRSAAALGKPAVTMREDQGGDDPAADQSALAALSGKSADVRAANGLHVSANGSANGRSRRACPHRHVFFGVWLLVVCLYLHVTQQHNHQLPRCTTPCVLPLACCPLRARVSV